MNRAIASIFLLLLLYPFTTFSKEQMQGDHVVVGKFSSNELTGWNEEVFDKETSYYLTEINNEVVLKSLSNNSASGLFKKVTVDIKKYPYLNWRWRVEDRFSSMDETQKAGDDYVARIYVVVSGGFFFWRAKALNYVWSSRMEKEAIWPNAFSPDNTRMIAVRTAEDQIGIWYAEKRNVYEELKAWVGDDVRTIDAIAIMTDTDNSGGQATAFYGDIYFSKE